jgi:hypothetical protein
VDAGTPDPVGLVRAYAYAVAKSLPRCLCSRLTYSSAFDCRTSLCFMATPRGIGSGKQYVFDARAEAPAASREQQPAYVSRIFEELAALDEETKRPWLDAAQALLDDLRVGGRPTLGIVLTACWLTRTGAIGADVALQLLPQVVAVMGAPTYNAALVDQILARLVDVVNAEGASLGNLISKLLLRAQSSGDAHLKEAVVAAQAFASQGDCRLVLEQHLLAGDTEYAQRCIPQMIDAALEGELDAASPLARNAFAWCLQYDSQRNLDFCLRYLAALDAPTNAAFVTSNVLRWLEAGQLVGVREALAVKALERLAADAAADAHLRLDAHGLELLRSRYGGTGEGLRQAIVRYVLQVHVSRELDEAGRIRFVDDVCRQAAASAYHRDLYEPLVRGDLNDAGLWERYLASCVAACTTFSQLVNVCTRNTFLDPNGTFETAVVQHVPRLLHTDFDWMTTSVAGLRTARERLFKNLAEIPLSQQTRRLVQCAAIDCYWNRLTYHDLLWDGGIAADLAIAGTDACPEAKRKQNVLAYWRAALADPQNVQGLCQILAGRLAYDADEVEQIRREVPNMLGAMLAKGLFSWDLLFEQVCSVDEGGRPLYDVETMVAELASLSASHPYRRLADVRWERPDLLDSWRFEEIRALKRSVKRAAKDRAGWLVDRLVDALDNRPTDVYRADACGADVRHPYDGYADRQPSAYPSGYTDRQSPAYPSAAVGFTPPPAHARPPEPQPEKRGLFGKKRR